MSHLVGTLPESLHFLSCIGQILQHQVLTLSLLSKGKVKDQIAELFLVHELQVLTQVQSCEVAVRLTNQVELVTCDLLQVVKFHEEAIVLDSFDTDHDQVVLTDDDDFGVDNVLALVLTVTATCHALLKLLLNSKTRRIIRLLRLRHRSDVDVR